MNKIIVIPLASKIHSNYENIFKIFKEKLENYNILDIIDSEDKLNDKIEIIKNSFPIFLILTGGTSPLASIIINKCNIKKGLILAHSKNNSLASAISIRNKINSRIYLLDNEINKAIKIIKALSKLIKIKIGIISENLPNDVNKIKELLSCNIELINYDEIKIEEKLDYNLIKNIDIENTNEDLLKKAIGIYNSIKKIIEERKINALAIDCFPFLIKYKITPCLAVSLLNDEGIITACEADLRSLFLMLIINSLYNIPSWIANIALVKENKVVFSHCTIATKLAEKCKLVNHYESNYPYSLSCKLKNGFYSILSIDRNFEKIAIIKANLLESGMIRNDMCRTQALFEINLKDFHNIALSNHHVIVPFDIEDDLKELASILGIKLLNYERLVH
jgi:L-fucose isomerase-like protein